MKIHLTTFWQISQGLTLHDVITKSCKWLNCTVYHTVYAVVYMKLLLWICLAPLSLHACTNLCQDCTEAWAHPTINTYRSSLHSGDHLVDVRPHNILALSGALVGKLLIWGKRKQEQRGGWMKKQIDESCLIWPTDSIDQWHLVGWFLVIAAVPWQTRRLILRLLLNIKLSKVVCPL